MAALELSPAREQAELEEYLGERFDLRRLQQYELELEREFAACGDEAAFYRSSEAYLYNLTAFAMTRTKLPYLHELIRARRARRRGSSTTAAASAPTASRCSRPATRSSSPTSPTRAPSTCAGAWPRRGLAAPIYDLDIEVPGGFDAAYAFDVIEHVDDPFAFLGEMERRADVVVVNLLEPEPGRARARQSPRAADRRDLRDARSTGACAPTRSHHGRSHLIAYEPGSAPALARLRGRLAILVARARRRGP